MMKRFGVLAHPVRPQTDAVCETIAASLRAGGMEVWSASRWTEDDISASMPGTDLVVAIGGDGALLRAARVCARHDVPVFGVNMGRLGFLTEVAPNEWDSLAFSALLEGRYWVEQRMMIRAALERDGQIIAQAEALNDVVISRGGEMGLVHLNTYIDGGWTTTYHSDALIVATATGSTAYALACGGPILPPEMRGILIVPVAPHLSLERPIVLPEEAYVELRVDELQTSPFLAVDGTNVSDIHASDVLRVAASQRSARFIRLREKTYFYRSLLDRLEPRVSTQPR
jgi:NAD+ kinase